jgi:hypothetical protein
MDKIAQEIQLEIDNLNNNRFSKKSDKMLMKITKSVKKIYQYSLDGELIRVFSSARQAAREYNTSQKHIISAVRNNKIKGLAALGFIWGYENEPIRIKKNETKKRQARTFLVFDSNMTLVNQFNSYFSLCEFLNITHTPVIKATICTALSNQKKFKGYWLVYKHEYKVGMTFCQSKANSTKIKQFTLNGELLREFKSLRELENITGINRKKLSNHLKNNGDVYNGFRFEIIIPE